jgi:class 3 adenylate cyclase
MARSEEFFETIIQMQPDSTIIVNQHFMIQSINVAAERQFEINESIIGTPISQFLTMEQFGGSTHQLLKSLPATVEATFTPDLEQPTSDFLDFSGSQIGTNYVYVARNITQEKRYAILMKEEFARSEQMLQSILPPHLVPRVMAGEQNISFSVTSASIVFLDVVEFTPWCGSNTAETVMGVLNMFFKELDAVIATLPTMTKIKCIGDCYMCAGGIFSEVNQPTVHAAEAVTFGLKALDALEHVNQELGCSLRIRVGINTGGPIVAGVIGCGKPTFEIIGPAINMAQQMEHHGIPMMVQISRMVYEIIYGSSFKVKERSGQVEIKGGNVVTYLVSR